MGRVVYTLIALWLGHFCVDFMLGIWPIFKTMRHLDLAIAGTIVSAAAFAGEGMQIVFGGLSDRGYSRALIASGVLLASAATFLVAFESYTSMGFLMFLTLMGSGAFHPAAAGIVGSLTENRKGLFITIFASGGSLGLACSQISYLVAYDWLNGHTAWLSLFPFVLALVIAFVPLSRRQANKKPLDFKEVFRFFRVPTLRYLWMAQVCNQALVWGLIFLLPDVLTARGYDKWIAFGGGHLALILGGACTLIVAGHLADCIPPRTVLLSSTLMGALLFYTFLFMPLLSNTFVIILLAGLGAAISSFNPVSIALGNRYVPGKPGLISAFLMGIVWCVAEVLGPCGGGLLTLLFSEDAAAKSLMVLGVSFLAALAVLIRLPEETTELVTE